MSNIQDTYNQRIAHFDKSYHDSDLRNDENAVDSDALPIKAEDLQMYHLSWWSEAVILAKRSLIS